MKVKNLLHNKTFLDIVLILAIGALSITWFRENLLFNTSDFGLAISRQHYLDISSTIWVKSSTGIENLLSPTSLLFAAFSYLTELMGIPLVTYEVIIFYIWFTMSGISMYILLNVIEVRRVVKISASLIYMMNPFSLIIIWTIGQGMIQKSYAFFPLIIGLYIWGIKKQMKFKYAVFIALIWLVTGFFGPDANVQFTVIYWLAIAIFLLIYVMNSLIKGKAECAKRSIYFTVVLFLVWVVTNLFWIGPMFTYVDNQITVFADYQAKVFAPNIAIFRQNSAQIFDSIRLLGYWAFKPNFGDLGGAYYEFATAYFTPLFVLITFLFPFLASLSFFKKGIKIEQAIFGVILVAGIIIVKGSFAPFGEVNEFFFTSIPILQQFRNPYPPGMMLVALSVSILTAIGIEVVFDSLGKLQAAKHFRLKSCIKPVQVFAVLFILSLLVGVLAFPFWIGDFSRPRQKYPFTSTRIQIPDYYYQFSDWDLRQIGDYRLMEMPLSYGYNYIYRWNYGYVGPSILSHFTKKDVVLAQTMLPLYDEIVNAQAGTELPNTSFSKLVGLMSVKYVVFHNDTDWEVIEQPYMNPYGGAGYHTITEKLNSVGLTENEKIGELIVFENQFVTPRVFATNNYISVDNVQSLSYFISLADLPLAIITDGQTETFRTINDNVTFDPTGFYFDANTKNNAFFVKNDGLYQLVIGDYAEITSIDNNPVNLGGFTSLDASNLLDLSGDIITIWKSQGAMDSFETNNNSVVWNIAQNFEGSRYINLPFKRSCDFTDSTLAVRLYGNNSLNTLTFQAYSRNGQWINWNVKDDWTGFRWLTFSLMNFDGSSKALDGSNTSPLDVANMTQLSIYYNNANSAFEGVSSVQISSILKLSSPEVQEWQTYPSPIFLSKGYHTINFNVLQNSLGVYLKRVVPEVDNLIEISYQRRSSSLIHVSIKNASQPFILVFSDSYNEGWSAFYGNFGEPMIWLVQDKLINTHFEVNGYANAWYIDKTGTFEVTLYYKPQTTFSVSLIVSGVTILLSAAYLIFSKLNNKNYTWGTRENLRRFYRD